MYFNSTRFDERINEKGELVTVENQNRKNWNTDFVKLGVHYLAQASAGKNISKYHIEAAIASEYCSAPSFDDINWNAGTFFGISVAVLLMRVIGVIWPELIILHAFSFESINEQFLKVILFEWFNSTP